MLALFTAEALAAPCEPPMIEYWLRGSRGLVHARGLQIGHFAVRRSIGEMIRATSGLGFAHTSGWTIDLPAAETILDNYATFERALFIADELSRFASDDVASADISIATRALAAFNPWLDAVSPNRVATPVGYRDWLAQQSATSHLSATGA